MTSETDIQYEVWQDGSLVAFSDDIPDAQHFMAVYGQDGPVEAKTAVTVRTPGFNARTPAPEAATWRAVPVEPTEAMLVNGREALMPLVRLDSYGPLIGVWKDMRAASPVVPVGSGEIAAIIMKKARLDLTAGFPPFGQIDNPREIADAIIAALRPTDTGREG